MAVMIEIYAMIQMDDTTCHYNGYRILYYVSSKEVHDKEEVMHTRAQIEFSIVLVHLCRWKTSREGRWRYF